MFKYNHDCPFEAYVSNLNAYNEGKIIGAWVNFPTDKETINFYYRSFYNQSTQIMSSLFLMCSFFIFAIYLPSENFPIQ